eukprot:Nk52_evm18s48 gene=Nk52_evmTU18s48
MSGRAREGGSSHDGKRKRGQEEEPVKKKKEEEEEGDQADYGLSGRLLEDSQKATGGGGGGEAIVLKYAAPEDAARPDPGRDEHRWRVYVFKGSEEKDVLHLSGTGQDYFLLGRHRGICDIPLDHPSCSKQHAVLQFRRRQRKGQEGRGQLELFLVDLDSSNGTVLNGERVKGGRYLRLHSEDVLRFGNSSREYVLKSSNGAASESSSSSKSQSKKKEKKEVHPSNGRKKKKKEAAGLGEVDPAVVELNQEAVAGRSAQEECELMVRMLQKSRDLPEEYRERIIACVRECVGEEEEEEGIMRIMGKGKKEEKKEKEEEEKEEEEEEKEEEEKEKEEEEEGGLCLINTLPVSVLVRIMYFLVPANAREEEEGDKVNRGAAPAAANMLCVRRDLLAWMASCTHFHTQLPLALATLRASAQGAGDGLWELREARRRHRLLEATRVVVEASTGPLEVLQEEIKSCCVGVEQKETKEEVFRDRVGGCMKQLVFEYGLVRPETLMEWCVGVKMPVKGGEELSPCLPIRMVHELVDPRAGLCNPDLFGAVIAQEEQIGGPGDAQKDASVWSYLEIKNRLEYLSEWGCKMMMMRGKEEKNNASPCGDGDRPAQTVDAAIPPITGTNIKDDWLESRRREWLDGLLKRAVEDGRVDILSIFLIREQYGSISTNLANLFPASLIKDRLHKLQLVSPGKNMTGGTQVPLWAGIIVLDKDCSPADAPHCTGGPSSIHPQCEENNINSANNNTGLFNLFLVMMYEYRIIRKMIHSKSSHTGLTETLLEWLRRHVEQQTSSSSVAMSRAKMRDYLSINGLWQQPQQEEKRITKGQKIAVKGIQIPGPRCATSSAMGGA